MLAPCWQTRQRPTRYRRGVLHALPFSTFGEIAALGLKATVYCPRCYEHRAIDAAAEHLRDRCFATTRFRRTKIRYTGDVCGCPGGD
jgi:hypothetical protein